jgi:hypothetical protein
MRTPSDDVYQKRTALNITLPPIAIQATACVPFVQTSQLHCSAPWP